MRTLATALLLITATAGALAGQTAAGVRATVRVPPILELTPEWANPGAGEVLLRVRANVPWRLTASLPGPDPAGSPAAGPVLVEVVGPAGAAAAPRSVGPDGPPVVIARSATPGAAVVALRIRWAPDRPEEPEGAGAPGAPGASAGGASAVALPRLLYALDPRDGPPNGGD